MSNDLTPPPGYGKVILLDRLRHAGLSLRERSQAWAGALNSVFLNAAELPRAGLDYPVAFIREKSGEYLPVALLGLRERENLFVDAAGAWLPHTYQPAYVRRHPFCLAQVAAQPGVEARQVICVQEDQLAHGGEPLFDSKGEPTAAWTPLQQLIEAMEAGLRQTRELSLRLDGLGLFTPFDAVAQAPGGAQFRLNGLYRVDEPKLNALEAERLRPLRERGELRVVYAHLLSLERFATLLDLLRQRDGRRTKTH
jgi:SapC protein